MIKSRRKTLLIEPHFQTRFMLRLTGVGIVATLLTAAVVYGFLAVADQNSAGEFFYVIQEPGTHPELLSRTQIVLPALVFSLVGNLILTLGFGLYYSQKLAGPLFRLIQDMKRLVSREPLKPHFQLRSADEFQEVGRAFDGLLKMLADKGFLEREK
ncbi:MAG: hypothetical protein A2X36_07390 [Elusimicrobia bacterium GWA2_69_24]|nr:MAG: hypothetical protein A2X36_07390 [Elusimicrobia bacterium GWA2_69_24]HBL18998.1 hypothetical protein [Elusimicrobiota bacterium]